MGVSPLQAGVHGLTIPVIALVHKVHEALSALTLTAGLSMSSLSRNQTKLLN